MTDVAGNAKVKLKRSTELAEMESRIASESKNGSGIEGRSVSTCAVTAQVACLLTAFVTLIETAAVTKIMTAALRLTVRGRRVVFTL